MDPVAFQTNPYLSLVRPNEPSRLIYLTDSRGPTYPDTSAVTQEAIFGVIGLDRSVTWSLSLEMLALLESAAPTALAKNQLEARHGVAVVAEAVERDWLQSPERLCADYYLRTAQIEVTAHCNWRCSYCPVSVNPKPSEVMPLELYAEVIEKVAAIDTIEFVTFHFFNEPTLDPLFERRISLLARHSLKLALYSNISALTQRKVDLLRDTGVLHHLIVNLPSLDPQIFRQFTQSSTFQQTTRNLNRALDAGFPITIVVNGSQEELAMAIPALRKSYEPFGVEIRGAGTCDRAGELEGEYAQRVSITGRLRGCSWPLNHAYISVRGELFLCCNDYQQREVYGHIRNGDLHALMTSPAAITLRRRVFGIDQAPDTYICRRCHDQLLDYPFRQFRPPATYPLSQPTQL